MRRPSPKFYKLLLVAGLAAFLFGCGKPAEKAAAPAGMVRIKGGSFRMGRTTECRYEAPVHTVEVETFYIDEHEVTVAEFAKFVDATKYVTDAEKLGWSEVFDMVEREWKRVDGADLRHPEGADSTANSNEPVCQISWNDAIAYACWTGKRLPTEAEFEYAERGGLDQKEYAWGDELEPQGKYLANWWQGEFPDKNTGEDGFVGRAPVLVFRQTATGFMT